MMHLSMMLMMHLSMMLHWRRSLRLCHHSLTLILWSCSLHQGTILNWSLSRNNSHWRSSTSIIWLLAIIILLSKLIILIVCIFRDILWSLLIVHRILVLLLFPISKLILIVSILSNILWSLLIIHWIYILVWSFLIRYCLLLRSLISTFCNIYWSLLIVNRVLILLLLICFFTVHFILNNKIKFIFNLYRTVQNYNK